MFLNNTLIRKTPSLLCSAAELWSQGLEGHNWSTPHRAPPILISYLTLPGEVTEVTGTPEVVEAHLRQSLPGGTWRTGSSGVWCLHLQPTLSFPCSILEATSLLCKLLTTETAAVPVVTPTQPSLRAVHRCHLVVWTITHWAPSGFTLWGMGRREQTGNATVKYR